MNLRIKTLCIVAVMAACMGAIHAQNLICPDIEQNGTIYGFDHVFTDPSPLKFVLTDWSVKGEWNVGILNRDGGYDDTEFVTENSWSCIFNPLAVARQLSESPRQYDDLVEWRFVKVRISFRANDGIEDYQYIRLNLEPTKPVLSDINFNCVYKNDEDFRYGYPAEGNMFSFTAESANAKKITVNFAEGYGYGWPFFGGEERIYYSFVVDYECSNGIATISDDYTLWGEYIRAYAVNDFGISDWCDPILTTWYITDPDILARIEELRQLSALDHPDADDMQPGNDSFEVYDVNGISLGTVTDLADIDRNSRKGLLIIKHLRDGITVRTFKLIN